MIDETVFLSKREDLGLETEDENKVIKFLGWVGVEEYPRIKLKMPEKDPYGNEYEDYVLRNLEYPYRTSYGETYSSYEKLKEDKSGYSGIVIGDIAELNDILAKARFEDILGWLHSDPSLQTIIREGHELQRSFFCISLRKKRDARDLDSKDIASYILWRLRKAEWVPTRSGRKVSAEICCLSRTLADMSPLVEAPAYDIKNDVLKRLNIKEEDIVYILEKIGASRDFVSLPDEMIYAILGKLESADPEGRKARAIYRQIIENKPREWAKNVATCDARNRFVQNGSILAKIGGELRYFPAKKVYYVDNLTFCKMIMDKFPIVQVERRSGKEQVREIFGVTPLEDIEFSLSSPPEIHPINAQFTKGFENFKPYIIVFRLHKPNLKTELNQLKKLRIVLCSKIAASYKFGETEEPLEINPHEHITAGDDSTAYLLMPPNKQYKDFSDLKADASFCDSIAEIVTGILKVGENRKDYRELFSKDRQQKDLLIERDLDDPSLEKLKQARQLFHSLSDMEIEFWQTVVDVKGGKMFLSEHTRDKKIISLIAKELNLKDEFLEPIYEGIYYEKYSSPSNMPHFKKLFGALGISVEGFNGRSAEPIDFTEYLESEITKIRSRFRKKFMSLLFKLLKDKAEDLKEMFGDLRTFYENPPIAAYYDINKELALDEATYFDTMFCNELFKDLELKYSDLLIQEEIDLESEYKKNLDILKGKLGETGGFYKEDIQDFLENSKNQSLLFLGECEELVRRFNKKYQRPTSDGQDTGGKPPEKRRNMISLNGKQEEYEEDDYQPLMKNIEEDLESNDCNILPQAPTRPPEKPEHVTGAGGGAGRGTGLKKQTKEIGFIGEYYIYNALLKKYSRDKVLWVSEYAKVAGINPNGNDAEGYDIQYMDEGDRVHYVDVKATTGDDSSFEMSAPEVRFGERHKSNYEIIMVQNVLTPERKAINLGKIFDYAEDESFSNNSKFAVENNGFRIRFEVQKSQGGEPSVPS